jgi:hypothetical protein
MHVKTFVGECMYTRRLAINADEPPPYLLRYCKLVITFADDLPVQVLENIYIAISGYRVIISRAISRAIHTRSYTCMHTWCNLLKSARIISDGLGAIAIPSSNVKHRSY